MTKTEIAKMFSQGAFEKIYGFIAEEAVWIVVEEARYVGKGAIINQCKQVNDYFKSVTTQFQTVNIIADGQKVAINGTAEFLKDNTRLSFVSACDLYEFNDKGKIEKITSYCIQAK